MFHSQTSNAKSRRDWREFERLVTRIEQVLVGEQIEVKSPDRVKSLITGRKREVDASLRTRIGSAEILVTIECRKRKATQDVTWIEQLGCKKQAIGAARTVAVASSSFSADAIRAAEHYGIDLRVLSEISDHDLRELLLPALVVHVYKHCELADAQEIQFEAESEDDFSTTPPLAGVVPDPNAVDAPVFLAPDDSPLTLNDLWLRADAQLKVFDSVPTDDRVHRRRLELTLSDSLRLRTRLGPRPIRVVRMSLLLRWKHERIPVAAAKVVAYGAPSGGTVKDRQVRAEFESKDATSTNLRVGVQCQDGSNKAMLTVQFTPGAKK